jgi:hypothetical protein
MANFRPANALRNAMVDAIRDRIDAGAGAGFVRIYDGTQPANAETAITTQVLLAEIPFADPSFAAASAGSASANGLPIEDSSANATGTATWARIVDSNGATVYDCDVGTSGASINLNTTSIVAGGPVRITSATHSVPAS